ncbi:hypothetical protein CQY20_21740 [Mycolicibacterium agri]|uniref:Transmembrane protein n=1 Tax=Mycolicibacterium agri TaxID=36811 RepID=A0A2A7MV06_MYCAG|nr:rhomboid-like protein [Mycolicibacterium agri]PEG35526.1 hypothetical protein CQY20_21740 [Mycolicibacterium agri]GFG48974.1 hypothetical protein MAGR_04150 [Mycolicibacterium agri]
MLFGLLRALTRIRITFGYAATLAVVTTALGTAEPRIHDRVISHASTNLHNLSRGHVGTLLVSAFVIDAGPIFVWLPGLVCLLATAELLWRSARLLIAFAVGHVGATVLVAIGLTAAVTFGWISADVTRATDVGMSYGASAVLGALTSAIPRWWRSAWTGWWVGVAVAVVAVGRDFTDTGHAVALLLGMALSTRFRHPTAWTVLRCVLAGVGVAFGYLMLANTGLSLLAATVSGIAGALVGERARSRLRRRSATAPPDGALEPGVA